MIWKRVLRVHISHRGGGHSFCGKAFGQIKTLALKKKKFSKLFWVEENALIQEPAATNLFKKIGNKYIPFLEKGIFVHGKPKKSAFTLAEVLITLGIIGVVASLTIPSLIQSYKKKVVMKNFPLPKFPNSPSSLRNSLFPKWYSIVCSAESVWRGKIVRHCERMRSNPIRT